MAANLNPSIYYTTSANDDADDCAVRRSIVDGKGNVLTKACKNFYKSCVLEGACADEKDGKTVLYNYINTIGGIPRFTIIDNKKCPYGLGVKGICLDPFFTVAGDMNHHAAGDVIFVDKLKGLKLPTGETHDGFMIIRDRGGAINGPHRFDFFTGPFQFTHPKNAFTSIGFGAEGNSFPYRKASGSEADTIRKKRNFPLVPALDKPIKAN